MFKIFAVILSLQLIIAPVAMAQSAGDKFRDGPAKNGGMDLYAKQLMGLATSAVGANILTTCKLGKMQPSLMIFMGGSLVHIASEIMGGKAQNENHKKRASSLKMLQEKMKQTPGGDLQRASLEEALKEEKETLAFINKRKMWVMAVTAIYLAATAMTFIENAKAFVVQGSDLAACSPSGYSKFTGIAISMAYSFVSSRVGGGGAISTYGGLLLGLAPMIDALDGAVLATYNTATARAITFGASTVLMGLITKGLMSRASATKKNIDLLEKALADFKDATNTNTGIATDNTAGAQGGGAGADIDPASGKNFAINQLPDGTTLPKECWSSTPKGMEFSSAACKNPVRLPAAGISGNINVPTLRATAGLTSDLAQQMASGNIGSAEATAAKLASQAGKLKQIRDNMAKQLNDKLIAKGEKPIDFEAESQKRAGEMMANFNQLSGSNSSLADMKASGAGDINELKVEDEKKENTVNSASAGTMIDVPSATGGIFTEGLVNDPTLSETIAQGGTPVEYEYAEVDVANNPDVSIFDQVSNRYLFQYNKLFEREKPSLEPVK